MGEHLPLLSPFLFLDPFGLPRFLFGAPLSIEKLCIAAAVGRPKGNAPVPDILSGYS